MKMKSILSGLIVGYAACMFLAASCVLASNKPTVETPMAIASVRYLVDEVDTAIKFYTKLTGVASVRYLIDDARAAVNFYTFHLSFAVNGAIGIATGRSGAFVALVLGLIGLNLGGLALARFRRSRSTD